MLRGLRALRPLRVLPSSQAAPPLPIQTASRAAVLAAAPPLRSLHVAPSCLSVISFNLADIGEGIAEAEILEWHVAEGTYLQEFDPVCDVQSDKATVDITSRYQGTVVKLHYEEGDMAAVGSPLIDVEVGDEILAAGDNASDIDIVEPEKPLAEQHPDAAASATSAAAEPAASTPAGAPVGATKKALMSPAVRNLVRKHNIDVALVHATGKDGRILKDDIVAYLEGASQSAPAQPSAPAPAPAPAPSERKPAVAGAREDDRVVPVTGIQKAMVKSMTAAAAVPTFGYADEVEMGAVMDVRAQMKDLALQQGVKLTVLPFILKGISLALLDYPILNAHVNADCTEMTYRSSHNLGVAMATPSGLLVPNVKDVQDKSVLEVARELNRLQELGAAGKLSRDDLTGGTFSLSNIGAVGGTYCRPVLVVPEVMIGAIGKTRRLPRFGPDDEIVAAHIMEASWTADHRVIDGVTVAQFSNLWKAYLENPALMLMGLR